MTKAERLSYIRSIIGREGGLAPHKRRGFQTQSPDKIREASRKGVSTRREPKQAQKRDILLLRVAACIRHGVGKDYSFHYRLYVLTQTLVNDYIFMDEAEIESTLSRLEAQCTK